MIGPELCRPAAHGIAGAVCARRRARADAGDHHRGHQVRVRLDGDELILIDELFTPDSSRFWPADSYAPGISPPSFDKVVRDYLETLAWDKTPPAPPLPDDVVRKTREKYIEAYRRITGREDIR